MDFREYQTELDLRRSQQNIWALRTVELVRDHKLDEALKAADQSYGYGQSVVNLMELYEAQRIAGSNS